MIVQRASEREAKPWRNGRGVQYEIAADGPLDGGWTWRLSTADIGEDVPFSLFPGVDRQFCVAEGAGVELTIDGVPRLCAPSTVTNFRGDSHVEARLIDGHMKALNLMTMNRRSLRLRIVRDVGETTSGIAIVAIESGATVQVNGDRVDLGVLDAVLETSDTEVTLLDGVIALLDHDE